MQMKCERRPRLPGVWPPFVDYCTVTLMAELVTVVDPEVPVIVTE